MAKSPATAVKQYFDYLADPPKRSRNRRNAEELQRQIDEVHEQIKHTTNAIDRLQLHQKVIDLEAELHHVGFPDAGDDIEAEFIVHAKEWAERKGIGYEALRQAGVPARVLREAGLRSD